MKGKCIGRSKEQAVHKRHQNGETAVDISRALGISPNTVRRCIERLVSFCEGRRPSPYSGNWKPAQSVPGYVPTPEEIAEECAKIRAKWTPAEERKRRVCKPSELEIAEVIRHPRGIHVIRRDVGRR